MNCKTAMSSTKRLRPENNAARERSRVKTLRCAFLELQRSLPAVPPDTKLSKLDVLSLATAYIYQLTQALQQDSSENRDQDKLETTSYPIQNFKQSSQNQITNQASTNTIRTSRNQVFASTSSATPKCHVGYDNRRSIQLLERMVDFQMETAQLDQKQIRSSRSKSASASSTQRKLNLDFIGFEYDLSTIRGGLGSEAIGFRNKPAINYASSGVSERIPFAKEEGYNSSQCSVSIHCEPKHVSDWLPTSSERTATSFYEDRRNMFKSDGDVSVSGLNTGAISMNAKTKLKRCGVRGSGLMRGSVRGVYGILHPIKKWPMRCRLYDSIAACAAGPSSSNGS